MGAHGFSKDQLTAAIESHTGRRPVAVRSQALLVISTYADGSRAVCRVEALEPHIRTAGMPMAPLLIAA